MTVAELIARLNALPQNAEVNLGCGGVLLDIGYVGQSPNYPDIIEIDSKDYSDD